MLSSFFKTLLLAAAVVCLTDALDASDVTLPGAVVDVAPYSKYTFIWKEAIFLVNGELGSWAPPIPIRLENMIDSATWNCVAAYHPDWKSALSPSERPIVGNVPASVDGLDLYVSDTRVLCALGSFLVLYPKIVPNSVALYEDFLSSYAIDVAVSETVSGDIADCMGEADQRTCLEGIAAGEDFNPAVVGAIIGAHVIESLKEDGWNSEGALGKDGSECTANCMPYRDTIDYHARNEPGPKGPRKKWEPLLFDTDKSFYFRQEHTVPHLGFTGMPRAIPLLYLHFSEAPNPKYEYNKEVPLVIERTKNLDDENKMIVEFMDNKRNLAVFGLESLHEKFPDGMSFEVAALYFVGLTAAEHDAILMAWRSKIIYDRVRPTTLIQELGSSIIESYAGPDQGVAMIKGQDWLPYILVQPHAEYPSGSSCLCTGAFGLTDGFISWQLGDDTSIPFHITFEAGSSQREPGTTPANLIEVTLENYEKIRDTCAQSRLDGGMHFTASIFGSMELCSDVGIYTLDYVKELVGGSPIAL